MRLKAESWLKFIGPVCCPVFSLFSASNTQQNCVIQSTRAAFSPQAVLRLSSQPNTNLAYSSASSGNFYKKKGDSALQSAFRYPGVCVCVWCTLGFWFLRFKLGIWLKHKATLFWTGCLSFFLMEMEEQWSWGGKWYVVRAQLNMGFLCRYVACLISGTPKCFQGHQFRGNLSSSCQPGKLSLPVSK